MSYWLGLASLTAEWWMVEGGGGTGRFTARPEDKEEKERSSRNDGVAQKMAAVFSSIEKLQQLRAPGKSVG